MATIQELKKENEQIEQVLASLPSSARALLQKKIEQNLEAILKAENESVTIGDGTTVRAGDKVYFAAAPSLTPNGTIVFEGHRREVTEVRVNRKGDEIVSQYLNFKPAEERKKHSRGESAGWYDADRFFASKEAAQASVSASMAEAVTKIQKELDDMLAVQAYVNSNSMTVYENGKVVK